MAIAAFPNPVALHLLTFLAGPLRASPTPTTPDLLAALTDTFGPAEDAPAPTDMALALAAFSLAADNRATASAIVARTDAGPSESFAVLETTLAITAALTILQTELTFERTPAGKWRVELHERAAGDALLKALAQAIMRALDHPDDELPPQLPK